MPIRANGKYLPPYGRSVATSCPSSSLEKKKNVRHENRMPRSENAKFSRYEAAWRKSRLMKAQTLRSVGTARVLVDDLGEDLRQVGLPARALENARPAGNGERDQVRYGPGRVAERELERLASRTVALAHAR